MKVPWWVPVAGLLCAGEAAAQIAPGRSGISTSAPLTNLKPYRELQSFGTCFAESRPKDALAIIATVPGSAEETKVLRRLVYGERATCLAGGTTMSMPNIFARGAIAEGLLRSKGAPETYRLASPSPAEVRDLHGVARCYASSHRAEAEKVLQTHPGGPEEAKAVGALWDDFRACMPNFKVRMNPPWVRYLLAEALLRLAPTTTSPGR